MALTRFQRAAAGAWSRAATRARKADWVSVAGDIFIVVLGIMIAFQLDRWAEHWSRNQERQLFVQRVAEESGANAQALDTLAAEFDSTTAQVLRISRAIAAPNPPARVDYGCGILHLPAARLQTATLDEAADTRALGLVPDAELRRLIHAAAARNRFTDRQLDYFRDAFQRFGERLDRYTLWRIGADGETVSCEVPIESLARDEEAVSLLTRVYRDRRRFSEILRDQLASQRALAGRSGCLNEGGC